MKEGGEKRRVYAKKYTLDLPRYTAIELPLNVVNDDKALELLGGKEKIRQSFMEKDIDLKLRLRPSDPYQHPISSDMIYTENVMLKIRLPKGELAKYNGDVSAAVKANQGSSNCQIEPVAIIDKNIRFREIADFQMNTSTNDMAQRVTEALYGGDYEKIKELNEILSRKEKFDVSKPLNLPPFSTFSKVKMPFSYNFSNNKGTAVRSEDGSLRLVNKSQPFKVNTYFVPWEQPAPIKPTAELSQYYNEAKHIVEKQISDGKLPINVIKASSNYQLVECVTLLEQLFKEKPIWLRRHLYCIIPISWRNIFKYALAYVAYTSRTGPWKQSYIKFGCDPKTDAKYAIYQTERFRVHTFNKQAEDEEDEAMEENTANVNANANEASIDTSIAAAVDRIRELPTDFQFDGTNIPKISTFQLMDVKDPDLQLFVSKKNLVNNVTERGGWYQPIALAQLRALMHYKLKCLVNKEPISETKIEQIKEMAINRYTNKMGQQDDDQNKNNGSDQDEEEEGDEEEEEEEEEEEGETATEPDDNDLLKRFKKIDPKTLNSLKGLIMQEDLMNLSMK